MSTRWKHHTVSMEGFQVLATIAGTKTQMRLERIAVADRQAIEMTADEDGRSIVRAMPSGIVLAPMFQIGDRVHLIERWRPALVDGVKGILYEAGNGFVPVTDALKVRAWEALRSTDDWRSPRHMPRWASRVALTITDLRLQRVQEMTEEDAIKEGMVFSDHGRDSFGVQRAGWSDVPTASSSECLSTARMAFANAWNRRFAGPLWNHRSVESRPWAQNHYVLAYTFTTSKAEPQEAVHRHG